MVEGKGDTEKELLFSETADSVTDGRASSALNSLSIISLKHVAL